MPPLQVVPCLAYTGPDVGCLGWSRFRPEGHLSALFSIPLVPRRANPCKCKSQAQAPNLSPSKPHHLFPSLPLLFFPFPPPHRRSAPRPISTCSFAFPFPFSQPAARRIRLSLIQGYPLRSFARNCPFPFSLGRSLQQLTPFGTNQLDSGPLSSVDYPFIYCSGQSKFQRINRNLDLFGSQNCVNYLRRLYTFYRTIHCSCRLSDPTTHQQSSAPEI